MTGQENTCSRKSNVFIHHPGNVIIVTKCSRLSVDVVNVKMYKNVNVIAFITRYKVNIVDTEARMVFFGGHAAKY